MKYNLDKHHRRSIRLKGYDYSQPGWYFITICVQNREMLFGDMVDGKIILNDAGELVKNEWIKTDSIRENINIDYYVIMPNHMHGIIQIIEMPDIVGAHGYVPLQQRNMPQRQTEQFGKSTQNSIPTIIKLFKSTTTKQINRLQNTPGLKIWQRNYYEHIIRNELELNRIRQYIIENPLKWKNDKYYAGHHLNLY
ncbi:MAG: transposase [Calditrichaceae bacterium]|nr:transposase [Calditrichaceae bacterium]MBN2710597.1 transposase [Calditrichaceae bacterium]RQV94787.1 MAG: transposase [Calditrichota bacterium]